MTWTNEFLLQIILISIYTCIQGCSVSKNSATKNEDFLLKNLQFAQVLRPEASEMTHRAGVFRSPVARRASRAGKQFFYDKLQKWAWSKQFVRESETIQFFS